MSYFFLTKFWTSYMYPFRSLLLRIVELDHKILELYRYKHSSEIKYSTLF
jgi:hypothetical protein